MARISAENHVKRQIGTNALPQSTRELIHKKVNDISNDIETSVAQAINTTTAHVNSKSHVILRANNIEKIGGSITAHAAIDMAVSNITESALELGKTIAEETVSESLSRRSSDESVAGLDDLQQQLNQAHLTAGKAHEGINFAMIVAALGGVIVLGLVVSKMGGSGKVRSPTGPGIAPPERTRTAAGQRRSMP